MTDCQFLQANLAFQYINSTETWRFLYPSYSSTMHLDGPYWNRTHDWIGLSYCFHDCSVMQKCVYSVILRRAEIPCNFDIPTNSLSYKFVYSLSQSAGEFCSGANSMSNTFLLIWSLSSTNNSVRLFFFYILCLSNVWRPHLKFWKNVLIKRSVWSVFPFFYRILVGNFEVGWLFSMLKILDKITPQIYFIKAACSDFDSQPCWIFPIYMLILKRLISESSQ